MIKAYTIGIVTILKSSRLDVYSEILTSSASFHSKFLTARSVAITTVSVLSSNENRSNKYKSDSAN